MGCVPSKNKGIQFRTISLPLASQPNVNTSLLDPETVDAMEPHPVQTYEVMGRYLLFL